MEVLQSGEATMRLTPGLAEVGYPRRKLLHPHYRFLLVGSEIPDEESQTRPYSLMRAVIGGAAILRCLDHFLSIPVLCYLVKWKARLEFVKRSLGVSFSWHLFTSMHGLVGRRRRLGRSSKHPFRS